MHFYSCELLSTDSGLKIRRVLTSYTLKSNQELSTFLYKETQDLQRLSSASIVCTTFVVPPKHIPIWLLWDPCSNLTWCVNNCQHKLVININTKLLSFWNIKSLERIPWVSEARVYWGPFDFFLVAKPAQIYNSDTYVYTHYMSNNTIGSCLLSLLNYVEFQRDCQRC